MKIVVTGANGQLGFDAVNILRAKHNVIGLDRQKLDVTNFADCTRIMNEMKPDVVIHCAAYTQVDLAEREFDQAHFVNSIGTRNIAIASEVVGAKIVFISTDYVFNGLSNIPYKEDDPTNPTCVYGKTKLAGEQFIETNSSRYFIVRTSWLYGHHGNNFVKTMLKLAERRNEVRVVSDQWGSPTYTVDLVNFIEKLIDSEYYGVYHASNTGFCSWYDFACAIFEERNINIRVSPCTTEEYQSAAPRPKYSVLKHTNIQLFEFPDLRPWRVALRDFCNSYNNI